MENVDITDWAAIHETLSRSRAHLDTPLSEERRRQLLEERQRLLDTAAIPQIDTQDQISFLIFSLNKERWGLRAGSASGIFRATDATRVPGAPHLLTGIQTWRGAIVSLVDSARLLGLSTSTDSGSRGIAIGIRGSDPPVALLVDEIIGTLKLKSSDIPSTTENTRREFLLGTVSGGLNLLDEHALADALNADGFSYGAS